MVEFAPSTGGLALWVSHQDLHEAPVAGLDAPPLATDGHTIFYAAAFERLPLPEQIGLIAHEVLHIALRHPQRFVDLQQQLGDVDLQLYTLCADAIVNTALGHLSWLRLPAAAITLEQLLASALRLTQTAEAALLAWDVEGLYRAIDDRRPADDSGRRQDATHGEQGRQDAQRPSAREDGPRAACVRALGRDAHADLMPGTRPRSAREWQAQVQAQLQAGEQAGEQAKLRADEQAEVTRSWHERLVRAHAGDGPHSMLRTLIADLPKARTPWEQVLRVQLARGLSTRPELSWSRPARSYLANQGRAGPQRRMPWEPGFSGVKRVPRLALIVDVSGSIDDALLKRFAREIEALTRRLEAALVLVIGDDRVRHVAHFAPGHASLRGIEFLGGGGTDFTPMLQEADRHRPDIGVVLTDLDGPTRFRPRWPVIWAVTPSHASAIAPFGRTLHLR